MAISEAFAADATVSTSQYSLTNDSTSIATQTDDGIYQLWLEANNMAAADVFDVKILEKTQSGGTQRTAQTWRLTGAQTDPLFVTPPVILMHGWDFTLTKISGTDRSFTWSIRKLS